jgi:hypothetical protein
MSATRRPSSPYPTPGLSLLLILLLTLAGVGLGCSGVEAPESQPAEDAETSTSESAAEAPSDESAAPETPDAQGTGADDCAGGVVLDDGTVESGYGFVPSSKWAVYAQEFDAADFPSQEISRVCVCWLRTRMVEETDFEVVFYEQQGQSPAAEPYASVPGRATEVPKGVDNAGRFYSVDIDGVTLPEGKSYIGVRFDPSVARFFFVCNDKSPESEVVPGFQKDDRSKSWTNVLQTTDSTFTGHRSVMIRAVAEPQ